VDVGTGTFSRALSCGKRLMAYMEEKAVEASKKLGVEFYTNV